MSKLRLLGLSNLLVTNTNINDLVSVLSVLRDRLQGVAVAFSRSNSDICAEDPMEAPRILFRVLRKMVQLQTVRLGSWDEKIAKDHVAGIK